MSESVGRGEERIYAGALALATALRSGGFRAYFVGGCVRDELLGLPIKDIDIATNARPEQVTAIFPEARVVGAKFGVVVVPVEGVQFEIATFRRDGAYVDHRHPESVSYGTIEEDAGRRDFTINALYRDPFTEELLDFVGGVSDLSAHTIRCVGDPARRFQEDALRLLRAVRFAARLDFNIEVETWNALRDRAPTIQCISVERHRDELNAMLLGERPWAAIENMRRAGILHWILPEIEKLVGVEQGRDYHPEGDVYTHTMLVLQHVQPRTVHTKWGALLHDVGKPATMKRDAVTGKISFFDHASVGASIAHSILARLRFSNDDTAAIVSIVKRHMQFAAVTQMRESTLRRFLAAPTIESDLAVHRADCLGSTPDLRYWQFAKDKLREFTENVGTVLPPPFINGNDLAAAGMVPGKRLGAMLRDIHERQLCGEFASREQALDWLRANPPE